MVWIPADMTEGAMSPLWDFQTLPDGTYKQVVPTELPGRRIGGNGIATRGLFSPNPMYGERNKWGS